jgi:hypothetical protein
MYVDEIGWDACMCCTSGICTECSVGFSLFLSLSLSLLPIKPIRSDPVLAFFRASSENVPRNGLSYSFPASSGTLYSQTLSDSASRARVLLICRSCATCQGAKLSLLRLQGSHIQCMYDSKIRTESPRPLEGMANRPVNAQPCTEQCARSKRLWNSRRACASNLNNKEKKKEPLAVSL